MVLQSVELSKIIYEKGCVQAGEEWMEHNLIIISTAAIGVMFFQVSVFSLCLLIFPYIHSYSFIFLLSFFSLYYFK